MSDEQTVFTTQIPTEISSVDLTYADLGMKFYAKVDGAVTKVRIFTAARESGIHTVRIWDCATGRVMGGPYDWDIAAGVEGWRVFELPHAVNIKANRDYIVSVTNSAEDMLYLFTRPGFSEPITNGDLVTYAGSGIYTPVLGEMPYHTFMDTNYFRDVVFVANSES